MIRANDLRIVCACEFHQEVPCFASGAVPGKLDGSPLSLGPVMFPITGPLQFAAVDALIGSRGQLQKGVPDEGAHSGLSEPGEELDPRLRVRLATKPQRPEMQRQLEISGPMQGSDRDAFRAANSTRGSALPQAPGAASSRRSDLLWTKSRDLSDRPCVGLDSVSADRAARLRRPRRPRLRARPNRPLRPSARAGS